MENATQALFMAASVLLLIVALTISISSFATLKTQVEDIVGARDEVLLTKDENGKYLNYIKNSDDVRTVGVETIISAFRRLRKEQYTIYIETENLNLIPEEYKDLKVGMDQGQEYNGNDIIAQGTEVIKLSLSGAQFRYVDDDGVINLLYNLLKEKKFKEYIGIYQNKADGVSEANKVTYKIITFVQQ